MESTLPPIEDTLDMSEPEPEHQPEQIQYVPYMYQTPPPPPPEKRDIFSELEKTHFIMFFVIFILGFFMGKTMQPVILRNL